MSTIFRYLTGGLEPDCVLVMDVRKDFHRSYLFVRNPDPKEEMWEGVRTMADSDAADFFGVDNCYYLDNLNGNLHPNLFNCDFYELKSDISRHVEELRQRVQRGFSSLVRLLEAKERQGS